MHRCVQEVLKLFQSACTMAQRCDSSCDSWPLTVILLRVQPCLYVLSLYHPDGTYFHSITLMVRKYTPLEVHILLTAAHNLKSDYMCQFTNCNCHSIESAALLVRTRIRCTTLSVRIIPKNYSKWYSFNMAILKTAANNLKSDYMCQFTNCNTLLLKELLVPGKICQWCMHQMYNPVGTYYS